MRFAPVIAAFAGVCGLVATYSIDPITGPAAWATSTAIRAYQAAIQSTQPAEHEAPVFGSDEPVFRYASIQRGSIEQTVTVTGALQPVKTIEVGSQLSGQLSKVYVDFNDPVRKDQPLAQIDPRTFAAKVDEAKAVLQTALAYVDLEKAKLDRAKVDLETAKGNKAVLAAKLESAQAVKTSAQKTLQRKLTLQSQNVVATTTVEDAQTDFTARLAQEHEAEILMSLNAYSVEGAQADVRRIEAELQQARTAVPEKEAILRAAEADLDRTVIRSPIDGVVVGRFVNEGQTLAVGLESRPTFLVAHRLEDMEIHAQVDEADIGRISGGQRAHFTVGFLSRSSLRGGGSASTQGTAKPAKRGHLHGRPLDRQSRWRAAAWNDRAGEDRDRAPGRRPEGAAGCVALPATRRQAGRRSGKTCRMGADREWRTAARSRDCRRGRSRTGGPQGWGAGRRQ